ncbi:DUF2235 domain-containing protein [Paraburkholderia sp. CNPSo 3274]|uniref:DUF2235 domain-containing protein n=1 Tax=Paraburkholderia sp. CNPSo 3274 TaxID=2940932 RepID=UPI0020B8743C|nr:DUF2235 domain-containing protein [Paraburkholderia sp. CNPSo 3274]MCP3708639.1 DUF2235 domain-containing protein [Paraburkholderia sp. CNPSo 3274]
MSCTLTIPDPLPEDGYRKLSPRELAQRSAAMDCIHKQEAGHCQGQVYTTIFFDGTGNNQDWVEPKATGNQRDRSKHSNVARLFNAVIPDAESGLFPWYITGVGTPMKEIGDNNQSGNTLGLGAGYMGADRINWGITRIFNSIHAYATDGHVLLTDDAAKQLVNSISSSSSSGSNSSGMMRQALAPSVGLGAELGRMMANIAMEKQRRIAALRQWEDKLVAVLKSNQSKRKVTSVNGPAQKDAFEIPVKLLSDYKAYWNECHIASSSSGKDGVMNMIHQHTRQYLQWRKALPTKVDLQYRDIYISAEEPDRGQLKEAQDDLVEQVNAIRTSLQSPLKTLGTEAMLGILSPATAAKFAWEHRPTSDETRELFSAATENSDVPKGVQNLFNRYLHDSRAGFRLPTNMEPQDITGGYLRYRNVYRNSHEQTVASTSHDSTASLTAEVPKSSMAGTGEGATV